MNRLAKQPWQKIAKELNIEKAVLFERIKLLKKIISAISQGLPLVDKPFEEWVLNLERLLERAGITAASFTEVSHCYERKALPGWNYNNNYTLLFSSKEYKKTGAAY